MAEQIGPSAFARLMNRFYETAADILVDHDAMLEKFVGDEVIGIFIPALANELHAARAIGAGKALLAATGHADPGGPWVRVGAGVHTGTAFVGAVGEGSHTDLTALGDPVNTTARLASAATAGEILVTDAAAAAGALTTDDNGHYLDQSFDTCRLPTALAGPPIEVLLLEHPTPNRPFGAKGVGESPTIPVPGAIACALRDAGGLKVQRMPHRLSRGSLLCVGARCRQRARKPRWKHEHGRQDPERGRPSDDQLLQPEGARRAPRLLPSRSSVLAHTARRRGSRTAAIRRGDRLDLH